MSAMMQASANPAPRSPKPNRRITATQVHGALVMVAEGRGSIRSKSEQKVTEWEVGPSPGYVQALVEVAQARAEGEAATGARLLAAICLKNVIGRRWRPRRGNAVDEREKDLVRRWLLDDAGEETDERVFAQLELCARRCAKNDWPATWRDAPSVYLTSYSRGSGRALRLFGAVVKELARKGLPRDRRVLREDAALLLPDVAAALRQASSSSDIDAIRILAKAATRLLNHADAAATTVYDCFLALDRRAITEFTDAAPRQRRKLQTVVVPLSAWRRNSEFARAYGAPFLQRAVAALDEPGLTPAGAVARLELCGDALGRAADGDSDLIAFARSHGPKLAQYCLNEALPLQPSELNEHLNDPEDYALHADDGWEVEAAYDDDIYEEEAYDADSTDAPDGCRAVRAAAERCLLSLLAVDRTGDSALSRMLVERAFGDDRRAAVEQAVGALATLSSDTVQQCRAFFAEADASLRAVGTSAASLTDALPGVDQAVGSLFASYFPSLLIKLRSVSTSDICVNAYRRRLYWLSRCWALAIEANGAALQALADVCVEDINDGDAAVATAALDVVRRFAARFPPSSSLLDAALQRASTFLESSDDLAEAALRAAAEACVAASKTPEHASIAADRVRAVASLGERIVNDGNAPSLIDACADCCRAALIAARNAPSSSQASVTACAFVALLLDDSRDVELCAAPAAARLWLDALRTLPLDDHDACVQACRQPAQALEKLCAPPRDLALAMDVAQVAHCLAILGSERCGVEAITCAARACSALAGEVSWRASGHVDKALEALLLVAPDVASTALSTRTPTTLRSPISGDVIPGSTSLGDGALQRLADDALDDSTAESVRAQHYAVLTRCCAHSPQEFAQALGEDRALGVYRAWLARKHVRGDSQNFDDGEARKGADVDGTSGDVLAARAATGALACLRLAACGDGQALLADLDGALTLVNEAVRRGPGASLRRSPRVADRATLETPVDADDANIELPLDALCAWRAEHDWARTDLVALARSALEAVAGRVGAPAVQEALEACDAAVLGQLGLAASPR